MLVSQISIDVRCENITEAEIGDLISESIVDKMEESVQEIDFSSIIIDKLKKEFPGKNFSIKVYK